MPISTPASATGMTNVRTRIRAVGTRRITREG
jgi:hypothetical protein